jgi:hypothetical protein
LSSFISLECLLSETKDKKEAFDPLHTEISMETDPSPFCQQQQQPSREQTRLDQMVLEIQNQQQNLSIPCTGVADDLLLLSPEDIVVATIFGVAATQPQGNNSLFVNQQEQQQKQISILKALIFPPIEPKLSNNNSKCC